MSEEVIELSVEETNKLRAELGLKPLRLNDSNASSTPQQQDDNGEEKQEVLEMSVDETNALRAKLGLAPLKMGDGGSSYNKVQDAKLKEKQEAQERAEREEKERLDREVQKGIKTTFTEKSLGDDDGGDINSWAAKLRQSKGVKKKKKKKKPTQQESYNESDLKGMNVSHAVSELEAGSTTVMTLADAPILETKKENPHIVVGLNKDANMNTLENINLAEQSKQADGLRKKRQLELGMGRAGGYAGFDDDEFLELGGTGMPSRMARRGTAMDGNVNDDAPKRKKGFQIGVNANNQDNKDKSDLFAGESGKAVSLEPAQADIQASDFLTEQEDLDMRGKKKSSSQKRKEKFEKRQRKRDKKERKKHRRRREVDEDEESEGERPSGKTLLDELEETADTSKKNKKKKSRKRNRDDDDEEENGKDKDGDVKMKEEGEAVPPVSSTVKLAKIGAVKKEDKRSKYDSIMEKGNARTQQAFAKKQQNESTAVEDEEPDDAFLNAALAKARRLKKLRNMNGGAVPAATRDAAEAVVEAVQSMPDAAPSLAPTATSGTGVTFSVDDTREFTRALRARSDQKTRVQSKKETKTPAANTLTTVSVKKEELSPSKMQVETVKQEDNNGNNDDEDVDMAELAKDMKDDDDDNNHDVSADFGTTANAVGVGRGLAGVVNLLKQTGDFTRRNAGKEEQRGRAKDERTYEDYESIDLKRVVKIDDRYATDKDREMAQREIKLEYRDGHGRLLTRKEAFRELCYQFHGHGSAKRKEEKKQKQIALENAEARLASQQLVGTDGGPGTLGALKATQKATGKAFVVHKT